MYFKALKAAFKYSFFSSFEIKRLKLHFSESWILRVLRPSDFSAAELAAAKAKAAAAFPFSFLISKQLFDFLWSSNIQLKQRRVVRFCCGPLVTLLLRGNAAPRVRGNGPFFLSLDQKGILFSNFNSSEQMQNEWRCFGLERRLAGSWIQKVEFPVQRVFNWNSSLQTPNKSFFLFFCFN